MRVSGRAFAAVPDAALAMVYAVACTAPAMVGAQVAGRLVTAVEMEAVALFGAYAAAMALIIMMSPAAPLRHRAFGVLILVGMGTLAVGELRQRGDWWPLTAFAVLLANRLGALFTGRLATEEARVRLLVDGLMALGVYLLAIGITFYVAIPGADRLAPLPPEAARWCAAPADLVRRFFEAPPKATWCAQPARALAGGALYYAVSAMRSLWLARRAT